MNKHTIEVDDVVLGLLINSLQFCAVVTGVATRDADKAARHLIAGADALSGYPPDKWVEAHKILSAKMGDVDPEVIGKRSEFGEPVTSETVDSLTSSPITNARTWEQLEPSEREEFEQYEKLNGFRREDDPRENAN